MENKRDALCEQVIDRYLDLAEKRPYDRISRDDIVEGMDMVRSNINHLFGSVPALRDQMMERAVATERLRIIATGLERGHPIAKAAPEALKKRALETLI